MSNMKYKILYCEDNKDLRATFELIVKDRYDNILLAENGEDGFEKYKELKPDIIITDIDMPKLDGLQLTKRVRDIDKNIPIVIATSNDDKDSFTEAIKLHVDRFLVKPIKKSQLLNVLDNLVKMLEDREKADKFRAKKELKKLKKKIKENIEKFSGIFIEPIMIVKGDRVDFVNKALRKTIGYENISKILENKENIDIFLEKREGYCSSFSELSGDNNKISIIVDKHRRIFQVLKKDIQFEEDEEISTVYIFQDITLVEYQRVKLENYAFRLENILIDTKYRQNSSQNAAIDAKDDDWDELDSKIETREIDEEEKTLLRKTHIDKISATDFVRSMQSYIIDEIEDLKEIEFDIKDLLYDLSIGLDKATLYKIISKLDTYAKAISNLQEFDELSKALYSTVNVLSGVEELNEENTQTIKMFLEAIFYDLQNWREIIFEKQDTEDIHYLDSSLFSSCLQLELTLTGVKPDDNDDDLEFF